MIKAFGFAILFAVIGLVAVALVAPLVLHGADFRRLGELSFPFVLIICGGIGFAYGLRRNKKH